MPAVKFSYQNFSRFLSILGVFGVSRKKNEVFRYIFDQKGHVDGENYDFQEYSP